MPPGFVDLDAGVVKADMCTSCGACETSCPLDLIIVNGESTNPCLEECVECGVCTANCPRYDYGDAPALKPPSDGSDIGRIIEAHSSRATDPRIRERAQKGGAVTGILKHLLESGEVDSVITVFDTGDWSAEARVATTFDEVLESAGSKYTVDGTVGCVPEAAELGRAAVVTLPCQAQALATSMDTLRKRMADSIGPTITVFCMEAFDEEKLGEFVEEQFGIPLDEVEKMDIANAQFIVEANGETHEIPVERCRWIVKKHCRSCYDFSGKHADISVGNVGSSDGYSTVLVRSATGERAFEGAVASQELDSEPLGEKGLSLVKRLSRFKVNMNTETHPPGTLRDLWGR